MKGKNELRINQATMREALQEYLSKRMPDVPLVVESVERADSDRYSAGGEFKVTVNVPDAAGATP